MFCIILFFVNNLSYSQNNTTTKYIDHPITAFNINIGLNYTGATKGALAPSYCAGIDFEHKFFIPEKLLISAGVNYKLTNIYDLIYGNLHIVELVFKVGKR